MSATKSELESPGGNRKVRPEIQRYVPGKTKISKQEQNQNDENSQKRLLGKLKIPKNSWESKSSRVYKITWQEVTGLLTKEQSL